MLTMDQHPREVSRRRGDHPWLDVPAFDQKGEELMQENVSQLRKVCRAARTDHALIKDLMKKTLPTTKKNGVGRERNC